jgi:hypothetical protein
VPVNPSGQVVAASAFAPFRLTWLRSSRARWHPPTLFYDAARDGVLIAGPATLLSIMWGHRARPATRCPRPARAADRRIGRRAPAPPRHARPGPAKLGTSLTTAAARYNGLLASLVGNVLPQVRRLEDLGIFPPATHLPEPTPLDAPILPVAAECYPSPGDGGTDGEAAAEAEAAVALPD